MPKMVFHCIVGRLNVKAAGALNVRAKSFLEAWVNETVGEAEVVSFAFQDGEDKREIVFGLLICKVKSDLRVVVNVVVMGLVGLSV